MLPALLLRRSSRRLDFSRTVAAQAAVHGYTTAFTWAAAVFALGALTAWLLLPSGAPDPEPDPAAVEPVFAH